MRVTYKLKKYYLQSFNKIYLVLDPTVLQNYVYQQSKLIWFTPAANKSKRCRFININKPNRVFLLKKKILFIVLLLNHITSVDIYLPLSQKLIASVTRMCLLLSVSIKQLPEESFDSVGLGQTDVCVLLEFLS